MTGPISCSRLRLVQRNLGERNTIKTKLYILYGDHRSLTYVTIISKAIYFVIIFEIYRDLYGKGKYYKESSRIRKKVIYCV